MVGRGSPQLGAGAGVRQGLRHGTPRQMSKMMGDPALMKAFTDKCVANGFFNHTFMSVRPHSRPHAASLRGASLLVFPLCSAAILSMACVRQTGSAGPCFCIWESKGQQTLEEMQTFIDGPDGPSMGALNNIVK